VDGEAASATQMAPAATAAFSAARKTDRFIHAPPILREARSVARAYGVDGAGTSVTVVDRPEVFQTRSEACG
jgi:hypothetical protein